MVIATCPNCSTALGWNGLCNRCLLQLGKDHSIAIQHIEEADPSELEALSRAFPQLEILRLVGRGGMGSIYHARQTALDRDVAIKIIDRRVSNNTEFLDRFEREAKALAKLSHPNIVAVYDFGRTESGLVYLMMEYVNGLNLREAMNTMPIEHREAMEMITALCSAVHYAHSKGVVHRDIKPENILLGDDGSLKLADFGIAKIFDSEFVQRLTTTQRVLGTLHYLAPEQLESPNEVDHRVDNYALGVVFYELLTRKLPIGNFEPPSFHNAHVNTTLDAIVMKALARRPTVRYQSADELRLAIQSLDSNTAAPPSAEWRPSASNETDSASVPFQRDDVGGLVDVLGSLYAGKEGIHIEYRMRDGIFGQIRSRIYTVDIPWDRILHVEHRIGLFSGKMTVVADTISALQEFPGSEEGRIAIGIKKMHYELADRVMSKVRQYSPRAVPAQEYLSGKRVAYNPVLAFGLIFFAILNAGFLAICQIILATALEGRMHAVGAVAASVLLGPIILAQFISGLIHAITADRDVARIGAFVSMIPVTPLALFTIPFGMWARHWLSESNPNAQSVSPKPSASGWGLTTTFFVRESKYARWISLCETTGTVCVVGLAGLYMMGFYPTRMNFRIVGATEDAKSGLTTSIQSRLQGVDWKVVSLIDQSRFHINCWQYQRSEIAARLRVPRAPTILCLEPQSELEMNDSAVHVTVVQSLSTPVLKNQKTSQNQRLRSCSVPFELNDRNVSKIRIHSKDRIDVTLSVEGMELFQKWMPSVPHEKFLGILVDGMVYGLADQNALVDRQLSFRWGGEKNYSLDSIQAAIRGPSMECELELMD